MFALLRSGQGYISHLDKILALMQLTFSENSLFAV